MLRYGQAVTVALRSFAEIYSSTVASSRESGLQDDLKKSSRVWSEYSASTLKANGYRQGEQLHMSPTDVLITYRAVYRIVDLHSHLYVIFP